MDKVIVVYEEGMPETYHRLIDIIREYFEQAGLAVSLFCMEDGMEQGSCQETFSDAEWKYICTLDMAGFQISTVLGGPRYNLMPAKQIHVVISEESFARYPDTEFALNLYLFLPDTMRGSLSEKVYIPNLSYYEPFTMKRDSASDKEKLLRILETVRKECETL